ncbi:MAG: hypothetical protein ACOC5L_02225 [Halobacteriota archaeon]
MDRSEIMGMDQETLLALVEKNFGVKINGLEDENNLSSAWKILEILVVKGWIIYVQLRRNLREVDGFKSGPGTIFAQYGSRPNFSTTTEGICKTGLIALELTEGLKV